MNLLAILVVAGSLYVGVNSGLKPSLTMLVHFTAMAAAVALGSCFINPSWLEGAAALEVFALLIAAGGLLRALAADLSLCLRKTLKRSSASTAAGPSSSAKKPPSKSTATKEVEP